jgi:hypothetical protein
MLQFILGFTTALAVTGLLTTYGLIRDRKQLHSFDLQLAWPSRAEAVEELRALRSLLEREGQMEAREAYLLNDVCIVLGMCEAETASVLGSAQFYIDLPVDL